MDKRASKRGEARREVVESKTLGLALCAIVVMAACVLFTFRLRQPALWDYDEAIYASVMRATDESGEWGTLKRGDGPWFEKPPLYFWAGMALGELTSSKELAYRLPSALAGILSIVLAMLIVYALTESYVIAAIGGFALLTSPPFLEAARQVRLDAPVTAAILFAFYSFIRGLKNERWLVGIGVGIAVGVLIKSVIGLFSVLAIGIWSAVHRDIFWLRNRYFWFGALSSVVIILPWHIYEALRHGYEFWDSYLLVHVVKRFEANVNNVAVELSNRTYFEVLLAWAQPWSTVFVSGALGLRHLFAGTDSIRNALAVLLFPVLTLGLFLSAGTKIDYYLTPIYPFMAVFVALIVGRVLVRIEGSVWRETGWVLAGVIVLVAVANTIFIGFHHHRIHKVNQIISEDERNAGRILAASQESTPVYAYEWYSFDTIGYYSNGRAIAAMKEDQVLDRSFFLVVHTEGQYRFQEEIERRLTRLYGGPALTLYRFTY